MSSSKHIVAAAMPHYNQNQYIEAAIKSLQMQVALTVVDDGSDEPTEFANIRLMDNEGAAKAINVGVVGAWHEPYPWQTWVSSDNTYEPDAFAALVHHAVKEGAMAAYSGFWYEEPDKSRQYLFTKHTPKELISREDCYYGPCFIIRSDCWLPHRGGINHDYDNWLRVEEEIYARDGKIVGLDRALCHYRAHPKRATIVKAHEYDADKIRAEAIRRRKDLGMTELLP